MAVSFFFVLSGFILTATYGKRESYRIKDFAVARFARIYPLYALCLILSAALAINATHRGPTAEVAIVWIKSFFLIQNWLPPSPLALSGPAWTLSAEAFFYLTFPFLLARTSTWSTSTLRIAFVFTVIGYALLRWLNLPINDTALLRLPDFLIGILAGRFYLQGFCKNEERKATLLFGCAFALSLIVPQFFAVQSEKFAGLMAPLFAMMILGLANSDALPARLLRSRLFVFLGGASYALYLFHSFVLLGTNIGFEAIHRSRTGNGIAFAIVSSIMSIALASALFVFVEEPAREWIRRKLIPQRISENSPESPILQAEPL